MKIQTAHYVTLYNILKGCPALMGAFCEQDHNFTWGDNNHSMIDIDTFETAIKNIEGVYEVVNHERADATVGAIEYTDILAPRLASLRSSSKEMAEPIYIELENQD